MYDEKHSGSEVSSCWLYLLITWVYLIYKTGWITAQKCDVSICRRYFGMSGVRPWAWPRDGILSRSQPAVTEPWPGPWLSCDLAVTELWSHWRCRDWAVTSPWLSCDLAVTELWPRRDWAVTSPSRDWAVIIGPRSRDHRGHRELTVSPQWAHGDHLFSHGFICVLLS